MRLVILAENTRLIQAVGAGLRKNSSLTLIGHGDPLTTSATAIAGVQADVVLLDDMDRCERATELIREISEVDEGPRVIVLCREVDEAWLEELFAAGAAGVISKSTHPVVMGMLLAETLKGHVFHRFAFMRPAGSPRTESAGEQPLPGKSFELTNRQLEILRLVAGGSTNSEVARELWVTQQTVKFHLRNIYRKLDVSNRTEASHFAHVNGLVRDRPALSVAQ